MMKLVKEIEARELAEQITIVTKIKNGTEWNIRLWIAVRLVELVCWIAWLNCEFVSSDNKEECG